MTKFLQDLTDFIFLEDEPQKADVIFHIGFLFSPFLLEYYVLI